VHELFPAAAIFVISGVTTPDSGELPPNARFLTKPFDPKRLVRELDKTLRKA
jgi:hypothetical protein